MKKILIGVLFVVGILSIGLGVTSLVYGQFGTQQDVVVGSNPYPVPPTTVGAYPAPFQIDMNGLESRTISNTATLRSTKLWGQYEERFSSCHYEDIMFKDGVSTIHIAHRAAIFKIDDKFSMNADVMPDGRFSMLLLDYNEEYVPVLLLAGGKVVSVEAGDYKLQFSILGTTDSRDMRIVSASILPVNGDFAIMVCNER